MPIWHVPSYLYPASAYEIFSQSVKSTAKQRKKGEGDRARGEQEKGRADSGRRKGEIEWNTLVPLKHTPT